MMRKLIIFVSIACVSVVPYLNAYAATDNDYLDVYVENDIQHYDKNANPLSTCSAVGVVGSQTNVATDFSLGTEPAERRVNLIKNLMNDYNLSAEQASGVIGNFMRESGGEDMPPDINEGGRKGPPAFSGGYGWAQWTGSRQRTFIDFAVDNGYMASASVNATDAANYAYLKHELNTGYQSTISALEETSTPEDAAVTFEADFERAGVPALEERKTGARQAFEEYLDSSGTTPGTSCNTQVNGAAIVGDYAFPLIGTKDVVNNPNMFRNNTADLGGHPYTAYDILADPGVPVAAFTSGVVTRVGEDRCPGRSLSIYNAESNIVFWYGHLDFNGHVAEGTTVQAGQSIGVVGPDRNGCGIAHLHIDASTGKIREGCSRLSCPSSVKAKFLDIGPQLFETFQAMPDGS